MSSADTLFHGLFSHRELRKGLFVHASDVIEDSGFTTTSSQHAGLSCVFFLDGDVTVGIGDRNFRFRGSGHLNHGLAVNSARDESFKRCSSGEQRIRHLVISVTPEWLDRDGLAAVEDQRLASAMTRDHLANRQWRVSSRLSGLVERILDANRTPSRISDLLVESAAVEIMAEALAAASHQDVRGGMEQLSVFDRKRLLRATDYIRAETRSWPSVESIAREAGVSASSLQRLFRAGLGVTVVDFLRGHRLDLAREELVSGCSVQEAAHIAGYSSTANFSTAFKRQFGLTPGKARLSRTVPSRHPASRRVGFL